MFVYVGSGAAEESLPGLDHAATLEDPKEGSSDSTGVSDAQPFGTYKPAYLEYKRTLSRDWKD